MTEDRIRQYTIPARLLFVGMLVLPILGAWGTILGFHESLPAGRYPFYLFILPFVIPAFLGFQVGVAVMRRFGIRVRFDDELLPTGAYRAAQIVQITVANASRQPATPQVGYCDNCEKDVVVDDDERCPFCRYLV